MTKEQLDAAIKIIDFQQEKLKKLIADEVANPNKSQAGFTGLVTQSLVLLSLEGIFKAMRSVTP